MEKGQLPAWNGDKQNFKNATASWSDFHTFFFVVHAPKFIFSIRIEEIKRYKQRRMFRRRKRVQENHVSEYNMKIMKEKEAHRIKNGRI